MRLRLRTVLTIAVAPVLVAAAFWDGPAMKNGHYDGPKTTIHLSQDQIRFLDASGCASGDMDCQNDRGCLALTDSQRQQLFKDWGEAPRRVWVMEIWKGGMDCTCDSENLGLRTSEGILEVPKEYLAGERPAIPFRPTPASSSASDVGSGHVLFGLVDQEVQSREDSLIWRAKGYEIHFLDAKRVLLIEGVLESWCSEGMGFAPEEPVRLHAGRIETHGALATLELTEFAVRAGAGAPLQFLASPRVWTALLQVQNGQLAWPGVALRVPRIGGGDWSGGDLEALWTKSGVGNPAGVITTPAESILP